MEIAGAVVVVAGIGVAAYAILSKLGIINKKIDPRKIRNFPKL